MEMGAHGVNSEISIMRGMSGVGSFQSLYLDCYLKYPDVWSSYWRRDGKP